MKAKFILVRQISKNVFAWLKEHFGLKKSLERADFLESCRRESKHDSEFLTSLAKIHLLDWKVGGEEEEDNILKKSSFLRPPKKSI